MMGDTAVLEDEAHLGYTIEGCKSLGGFASQIVF